MQNLPRLLRVGDLVLLTLGAVIGSGIFIVPATVLHLTGGELGAALLAWTVGGVLSILGALTYAELAAMKPESGGLYVYIRDAFGRFTAFLYGWALFFVISSGTIAALAAAFSAYFRQLVPLTNWEARGVSVAVISLIAALNVLSTRKSATTQNWTTAIKVAAILGMSIALFSAGKGWSDVTLAFPAPTGSSLAAIGAAMVAILWAYEGWQYVTFSAGEVVDPQRNFARGIVIGMATLLVIYLLANLAYVAALGTARSAQSERIAAEAMAATLGPAAGKVVALAILVSIFSAANAMVLTSSRVYYAMARDGVFFRKMAEVHPRRETPAFAVLTSSAWAAIGAVSGTFEQLLTYVVFTGWAFYALGAASLFVYRRREPNAVRPFRVPGYPWAPLLFIAAGTSIVLNTLHLHPGHAIIGIGIVLLGAPAFLVWSRAPRPGAQPT